jgi:hypothetical protein
MPQYHFVVRNANAQPTHESQVELPDDDAAIENARLVLSQAARDATMKMRLLDEEIAIVNERGAVIAVVSWAGGTKH